MWSGRRILRVALAAIAALAIVPIATIALSERFGWNWTRPWVERAVGGATGRAVEIAGDLDVDLGLRPRLSARTVKFQNAPWGRHPQMFTADEVAVRVRLLPLLIGRVRLDELRLDGASVLLEVDDRGEANWTLRGRKRSKGRGELPLPAELVVRDSQLTYLDSAGNEVRFDFETLDAHSGEQLDVVFTASGRYQKQPMKARGVVGAIEQLRAGDPYPVRAEAVVGPTYAKVVGLIQKPKTFDGVNLALELRGKSLAELWPLVGLPLAETPPYRVAGRLGRSGETWGLYDFDGVVGSSDLAGRLKVTLREERAPFLAAAVRSKALDLDDVEGFWGREVAEERRGQASGGPLFSDRPFDFAKLRAMDAAVDFQARTVRGGSMLEDVRLKLALDRGRLRLDPLELGFAGGRLASHATLDARAKTILLAGDVVLRSIDLARLLKEAELVQKGFGTVGGRAEISTRGNSLRAMATHLAGDAGVVMQDGELSEELIELAALDLGEMLVRRVKGDHAVPIRCMVGVFDIDEGRMTAETLLMDTRVDRIVGEGVIDLANERLDLRLYEHPRRFSVGSLPSPILIDGTLAERRVQLDRSGLVKRGGAALLLGALLHPAAALLALVELEGRKEPGACTAALHDYQQIASNGSDPKASRQPSASKSSRPGSPDRSRPH